MASFSFFFFLEDTCYFPRLAVAGGQELQTDGAERAVGIPSVGFGSDTMATWKPVRWKHAGADYCHPAAGTAIPCSAQLVLLSACLSKTPCRIVDLGRLHADPVSGGMTAGNAGQAVRASHVYMELPPMRIRGLPMCLPIPIQMHGIFWRICSVCAGIGAAVDRQGYRFFEKLIEFMTPVMALIGLPKEAAIAFIFGFFRRDYGAAGLYDLQSNGLMGGRQLVVAAVTLTLFIPCVAQFLVMKNERGWKVACAIGLFVSTVAFSSGYLLNRLLLAAGMS